VPALVSIKVDDKDVRDMLERVQRKMGDTTPLMRVIGEVIRTSVDRNFAAGGRPKWKKSHRAAKDGGETLSLTGRLRRSITVEAGSGWAAVGTNVIYAAIHQMGGKTRAHTIEPRTKKALRTPYGIFRRVRHPGSNIPARPFLAVQDEDWTEIRAAINDYLVGR
jgi:phage virion morphogenesis protein